jgi:trehalose utilization protein
MADAQNSAPVRVLVWDENPPHAPKELYPKSINGAVADALNELGGGQIVATTRTWTTPTRASPKKPGQRRCIAVVGPRAPREVSDETAALVKKAVHENGWASFRCTRATIPKPTSKYSNQPAPARRLARDRRL